MAKGSRKGPPTRLDYSASVFFRGSTLKFSRLLWSSLVIGFTACSDAASVTDGFSHVAPPLLSLRVFSLDSGGVLKITTHVSNPTSVHLQVANSPQCPFSVRIYPDSIEQVSGPVPGAICYNARTTDLAPGDSLILSRIFSATDLAQYTPGLYSIEVTVALDTISTASVEDGTVRLPLSSKPSSLFRSYAP